MTLKFTSRKPSLPALNLSKKAGTAQLPQPKPAPAPAPRIETRRPPAASSSFEPARLPRASVRLDGSAPRPSTPAPQASGPTFKAHQAARGLIRDLTVPHARQALKHFAAERKLEQAVQNFQGSPELLKRKLAAALGEKPALPGFKGALEMLGAKSLIDGVTGAAAEHLGIAMDPVAQDAAAVEQAAQESPAAAAAKLEELLNAHPGDAAYSQALLEQTAGVIEDITAQAASYDTEPGVVRETVASLQRIAETLSPESAAVLADAFTRGVGDFANTAAYNPALLDALSVADHGIRLGIELTASLERAGRTDEAFTISSRLTFAVNEVQDDFQSAAETVQALNQELLILQQQWAGVLTEEQIAQGVAEFQERHEDEYKALEDAAARLNHIYPGLAALEGRPELSGHDELEDLAERGVEQFEVYSQTQIGAETITDQVQKSGDGLPTWLDSVVSLAESVHGSAEAADNIVQLMFRAVAGQGALLAQSQDTAGLERLFRGLKNTAGDFIQDPAQYDQFLSFLSDPATANLSPQEFSRRFAEQIGSVQGSAFGAQDGALARSFGVLGAFVSAASLYSDAASLEPGNLEEGLRFINDTIGLGHETAQLFENTRFSNGFVQALSNPNLGKALGVAGALFDVVDAAQAFAEGDIAEGGISVVSAAGGLALALGTGGVAVVGAIAVGLAALAKVGLGLIDEFEHRAELEADSKAFLEAAGFTPEQAEHLGQYTSFNPPTTIGPFLTEYAEQLGISTAELGEQLMAADPKTLEFLVDHKDTVSALGLSVSDVAFWQQIDPELSANDIHTLGLAGQGLGLEGDEFTHFLEELYSQSNPTPAEFIEAAAAAQTAYHGAPPAGASEEEYQRGLVEYVTQVLREEFPELEDLLP
jgi:hypothetical protein